MYDLTKGSLEKIMRGIDVDKPVLQILNYKKVPGPVNEDGSATDRYKLVVSDGQKFNSITMLATQLNDLITNNILNKYAICKITNNYLSWVNNSGETKCVMLILGIDVLVSGDKVGYTIGNPTDIKTTTLKLESDSTSTSTVTAISTSTTTSTSTATSTATAKRYHDGSFKIVTSNRHASDISTTSIAALRPDDRRMIKACVTSKSSIRTWSNSNGEGKLFFMDLTDESGEIRCTAFKNSCDKFYKFYDLIVPENVYYISGCNLRLANKQYNTLRHEYEMIMTRDTEIVPCHESGDDGPTSRRDFASTSPVESKKKNDASDVSDVTTVNDVQRIMVRSTGLESAKSDISIVDDGNTVTVTLSKKRPEDFDGSNDNILATKGARVSEFYAGENSSFVHSSGIVRNPDLPEAHRYAAVGHSESVRSLSRVDRDRGDSNAPLYTFQEATEARLGEQLNRPDLFAVVATIKQIKTENLVYQACPAKSCEKKLIDRSTGIFRCEKCNVDYTNFTYRLLADMELVDATGTRWITVFNDEAEKILGMSARELGKLKENDNDAYLQKIDEANFETFKFNLKAELEVCQNEIRIGHKCQSVAPINYKTDLAHLIGKVSELKDTEKLNSN